MTAQCPPQTDAFQDLSRIFANRDVRVLEFEILPPAFGPILEDGNSIGITKKHLVQAFVVARKVFFDNLAGTESKKDAAFLDPSGLNSGHDELDKKLLIASDIILLFDCEHLTACNWRKRRLSALFSLNPEALLQALDIELSLMITYLCSPLHRHTKSPTLWQHRQWVQSHLVRLRKPGFSEIEGLFQAELRVVLRAGELHPRNYYAFTHLRQIHRMLSESGEIQGENWRIQLGRGIVEPTLDCCLAHPADISGLMFLLYLLDVVPDTALRSEAVGKLVRFALDIGWEGESIWTVIDLAVRKFQLLEMAEHSQSYPWSVLGVPPSAGLQGDSKPAVSWRIWLDRARVHWATEPIQNHA
ncbi:hypothetical protein BDW74DRAFT_163917 [Aspergillus multicolor]|uniref:uncharacterized protein n=1 Tax=Aspergillus multicolor TaxID=41759 RepID=UPI003CCE0EE2